MTTLARAVVHRVDQLAQLRGARCAIARRQLDDRRVRVLVELLAANRHEPDALRSGAAAWLAGDIDDQALKGIVRQ